MPPKIYLSSSIEAIDENLIKLINFCGLSYELFNKSDNIENKACIFLNCNVLKNELLSSSYRDLLIARFSHIFLYNLSPASSSTIEWLTGGKISVSIQKEKNYYPEFIGYNSELT